MRYTGINVGRRIHVICQSCHDDDVVVVVVVVVDKAPGMARIHMVMELEME